MIIQMHKVVRGLLSAAIPSMLAQALGVHLGHMLGAVMELWST